MKDFFDSLRNGEFKISVCTRCQKKIWPVSYFCSYCLSTTILTGTDTSGILMEYSRSFVKGKEGIFGIVNMGGVFVVGRIFGATIYEGMPVKMASCGVFENGDGAINAYYDFVPEDTT
jgi:uncharacterized OB-fold protein